MATTPSTSDYSTSSDKFQQIVSEPDYDGPQNPLNQFRSYAYHFVLYVADTTENAEKLGNMTGEVDQYDEIFGRKNSHESTNVDNYFDKYDIREFGGVKYVTLINSFEDADLIIDDFQHTAATTVLHTNGAKATKSDIAQVGFDTTFKIFEPMGCRLLEILSKIHISLNIAQPTYGLKIYFIGRQDELALTGAAANSITPGPDGVGFFYALKPILFTLSDIQMNVTHEGSMYQVSVSSIVNPSSTPIGSNVNGSANVETRNPTLEQACQAFVKSVNDAAAKSKKYVDEAGKESTIPVIYAVEFEDTLYQKDPNIKKHIKDSIVDNITNAQRGESGLIIHPPAPLNFAGKIGFIVKLCTEITNIPKDTGNNYAFAITASTDTKPDKITHTVHVTRTKLMTVAASPSGTPAEQAEKINDLAYEALKQGQLLHYQYYFSGKNVDIIRYDMAVSIGLYAVFSSFSPAKPPNQKTTVEGTDNNSSVMRHKTTEPSDKASSPNVGIQTTPSSSRNLNDPGSRDAFVEYMRQWMLGEDATKATMVIRGNPKLLQSCIATPTSQSQQGQEKAAESTEVDQKNIALNQMLVKIDVFSPSRRWNSYYTEQLTPETTFQESFWHGGLFHLITVKSAFVRGVFTQELTLNRLPTDANKTNVVKTAEPQQASKGGTKRDPAKPDEALSNQPQGNCDRPGLGKLSAKHESGAAGEIAIGYDNKGGWSYGSYQIATKTGTFAQYMEICRKDYPSVYEKLQAAGGVQGAAAGTQQFKNAWKSMKGDQTFKDSQHEFVRIHIFNVMVQRIKKKSGVDICKRSNGLQDAIWSTAVHHGPYKQFPVDIIDKLKNADDATMINAIYDERSNVDKHFASQPQRNRENIRQRFVDERAQALTMSPPTK